MDLNALQILIKVAECKSFTTAASQLGTSQSRLSRAVAQLEKDLGTRLLQRADRQSDYTALPNPIAPMHAVQQVAA